MFFAPFVIIDGTFSIGPEGEIVWCPGDSLSFELGMPYNTNITWYRNGQPIPGAVSNVLKVTQDGSYSVSAAPEVCPDYIQWLGVPLEVIYCTTGIGGKLVSGIRLVDKGDAVYLMQDGDALCDQRPYRIFDGMGRLLGAGLVDAGRIPVAGLPPVC
ncbi:MAG: hypothetical protein IPM52_10275 [Bacteroidetes bacterium]|nr:hypothetical protein [Bacteroidota bacterium]